LTLSTNTQIIKLIISTKYIIYQSSNQPTMRYLCQIYTVAQPVMPEQGK
jgi:hypothetical protein